MEPMSQDDGDLLAVRLPGVTEKGSKVKAERGLKRGGAVEIPGRILNGSSQKL